MNVGNLRHTAELQSYVIGSPSTDAHGQPSGAWVTLATRAMSIEPLSGALLFAAQQQHREITTRIRLRWYDVPVDADLRVKRGSTYYYVQSVINFQERNVEMQLLCRSGTRDA